MFFHARRRSLRSRLPLSKIICYASMTRLEHVGIAVRNADIASRLYDLLLGLIPYKMEEVEAESVVTYFLNAGGTKLEFVSTEDPDSAIGRFLARNGPGLHHLAFEVDDLQEAAVRAAEAGIRVLGDGPTVGADGKNVVFLHPKDTHGVLIEFCKSARPIWKQDYVDAPGQRIRYFAAGAAGNPVLVIVSAHFRGGLGQLVPRLESDFHIIGIEAAEDYRFLGTILENETHHASELTYLLTTESQAANVASVVTDSARGRGIERSVVVCSGRVDVSTFNGLTGMMLVSTEQVHLPEAFAHVPVAILPYPVSATESTFLDWMFLLLKTYFVRNTDS